MKTFQKFIAEAYIKKSEVSGHVNVKHGSVPGKATDASIKGAVDKAIDNPGKGYFTASEKGKPETTWSGGINVTGTVSTGPKPKPIKPKPEPEPEPESKTRKPREVTGRPSREGTRQPAPAGSGGSQKGTKIYVKHGKTVQQTSLRDLSPKWQQRVINNVKPAPADAGKYAGKMPTAVVLDTFTSTIPRSAPRSVSRGQGGVRPVPTQPSSGNQGGVRQVSQQPSSGNQGGVRRVSQQPSSLGRRSLGGF